MKTILSTLFLFVSLSLIRTPALAQPSSPNRISFQGTLNGADGKSLPDGSYNLTFRFWDAPAPGGNPVGAPSLPR